MQEFSLPKKFNWELASKPIEVKPYKVYSALLTQSGVADPVATVFENTIGEITWTRDSESNGVYFDDSSSLFTEKIMLLLFANSSDAEGGQTIYSLQKQSNNRLFLVSALEGTAIDDLLYNTPVEIRIYN
jgi:hypothetical protein